jgi:hypothetical protein
MKNEDYKNRINSNSKIVQFQSRSVSVSTSDFSVQVRTTKVISINTRNSLSDAEIYSKIISLTKD